MGKKSSDGGNSNGANKSREMKTLKYLQSQWAESRDFWLSVPLTPNTGVVSIQNRVRNERENCDSSEACRKKSQWPEIVQTSILYGFGAYNPRGQTVPNDINKKQHELLHRDIESTVHNMIQKGSEGDNLENKINWWQGASLFPDGSSERGFIIAFDRESEHIAAKGFDLVMHLATKYNQGAIYRYSFEFIQREDGAEKRGRLMRETIAVLDPGTDATVEVIRDDTDFDLSLFL